MALISQRTERRPMDPGMVAIFIPIIALSGVTILIGLKMRYDHIRETRLSGGSDGEVERLAETVDSLRSEIALLQDEHHRLNERVDFTERLLEGPKKEE